MSDMTACLEAIHAVYPGFVIQKTQAYHHDGQFNDILIINDDFIFRFPRYAEDAASLAVEVRLLQLIQGAVPIPVPIPTYINLPSGMPDRAFLGYQMLPGEPLWRKRLEQAADGKAVRSVAQQLARFLNTLHNIPTAGRCDDLPVQDAPGEWEKLYAEIRASLYPCMRPEAQALVGRHFETYFNQPHLQGYTASLRHGDFGQGNILYDPETFAITGIIDFDFAGLGDPAVDIASVSCFGEPFFMQFCQAYPGVETLLARAQFYKGTYALQEALHGYKNNDPVAFESGMLAYK